MVVPQIDDVIESYLTSLPEVFIKIKSALENEDSTTEDIAAIINKDPVLTARLLKLANSPYFGIPETIDSISEALTMVGRNELHLLVLSTLFLNQFKNIPTRLINMRSFWRHSIACGVLSQKMASKKNEPDSEVYFLCGMLHNLGTLVMLNKIPTIVEAILLECKKNKTPLVEEENNRLGYNHCDIGGSLFEVWNFPRSFIQTAFFHHEPQLALEHCPVVWSVHVADLIAREMELGTSGEHALVKIEPSQCIEAGLPIEHLEQLKHELPERIDEIFNSLLI